VPSRRTTAAGILPWAALEGNLASPSWLRSVSCAARLARATPPTQGVSGRTFICFGAAAPVCLRAGCRGRCRRCRRSRRRNRPPAPTAGPDYRYFKNSTVNGTSATGFRSMGRVRARAAGCLVPVPVGAGIPRHRHPSERRFSTLNADLFRIRASAGWRLKALASIPARCWCRTMASSP
jgi:hypothetical protein